MGAGRGVMASATPEMLTRSRNCTVSKELDEATSELLHLSLDIHGSQHPSSSQNRGNGDLVNETVQRRSEKIPYGYNEGVTSFGLAGYSSSTAGASTATRPAAGMRRSMEVLQHDLVPSSGQLLKRMTSADDLLIAGADQDDEDEADFSSDVR